jgi:hypothetical protein
MHVWLGTSVIASDGAKVGHVSKVIVHPASWKVLGIVVQRAGFFNRREFTVNPEAVKHSSNACTALTIDRAAAQCLPAARATARQRPPRDWLTPLGWPPGGVYWPAGYDGAVYPELRASDIKRWGTLRSTGWSTSRTNGQPACSRESTVAQPAAIDGSHLPSQAGDRLEMEAARQARGESLIDVDPYDVLARTSECGFKTAFERDDASMINPQPRPPA